MSRIPFPLEGGCLCTKVRYRVLPGPADAGYCHCTLCRRASGAPVQAWFTVPTSHLTWLSAPPRRYLTPGDAVRTFCPDCGSPLTFNEGERIDTIDITICTLDQPQMLPPTHHIWTASRLPWMASLGPGLPAYTDDPD